MSVVLHDGRRLWATLHLSLLLDHLIQLLLILILRMMMMMMVMTMEMLALPMRCLLDTLPFVTRDKKGE